MCPARLDLPPENKSGLSLLRAQDIFINEGRVVEYLSIDGMPIGALGFGLTTKIKKET